MGALKNPILEEEDSSCAAPHSDPVAEHDLQKTWLSGNSDEGDNTNGEGDNTNGEGDNTDSEEDLTEADIEFRKKHSENHDAQVEWDLHHMYDPEGAVVDRQRSFYRDEVGNKHPRSEGVEDGTVRKKARHC